MALVAEPSNQPRLPGQQADVAPGSPTALVALFTEVVRERFRPANALAWVWRDSDTPALDETGSEDGPRLIHIGPAFAEHEEKRNYRPAIYIDKGETQAFQVVTGNVAGRHLPSGLTGYYAHASIPIDIACVSDKKGESGVLADTVWFYMLAGRELIAKTFGLHDLSMPALGRTLPGEKDKLEWVTHVAFNVTMPLRWTTKPIAPLLQSVLMRFFKEGDPDALLLEQYIP